VSDDGNPANAMRARRLRVSEELHGLLFVAPALLLLVVVLGFPAIAAGLQSVNMMWVDKPGFSLAAYRQLASDPVFTRAAVNTLLFVVATVAFHLLAGLALALLLNLEVRGKWLFRVAALLPWTVPDVVAGLVWRFMFDPLAGFVNSFPIGIVSPYLAYPGWGGKIDSDGVPLIQQAILGKIPAKDCLDKFADILKKEMS